MAKRRLVPWYEETPEGCWRWLGYIHPSGYGRNGGRQAHRIAYEERYGPIPQGMTVDHLCFNPPCINPDHLQLLDRPANAANQRAAYKTHCINGHEFTPENTYARTARSGGKRQCRTCNREAVARYQARRQAA